MGALLHLLQNWLLSIHFRIMELKSMIGEACPENLPWLILLRVFLQLLLKDPRQNRLKKEVVLNLNADLLQFRRLRLDGSSIKLRSKPAKECSLKISLSCTCTAAL